MILPFLSYLAEHMWKRGVISILFLLPPFNTSPSSTHDTQTQKHTHTHTLTRPHTYPFSWKAWEPLVKHFSRLNFKLVFNWKKAGKSIWPPLWFFETYIFQRKVKTFFFCDFKYFYKSHLSWKFHWNFSSGSEDMKIFLFNIN